MAEIEFKEDIGIYPRLVQLVACLTDEITKSGLPEPCFIGAMPGQQVAFDGEGCGTGQDGMAWVRLASAYPSTNFPTVDQGASALGMLAYSIEVGIVRTVKAMDDRGNPISLEDQLLAVRLQAADMAAIRRAISCCLQANPDSDYFLGTYTPYGPMGEMAGGFWTVTVGNS